MEVRLFTYAAEAQDAIGAVFMRPGEALMPVLAAALGRDFDDSDLLISFWLSAGSWLLAIAIVATLVNLVRRGVGRARTAVSLLMLSIRARLVCRKQLSQCAVSEEEGHQSEPEVHLDNLDLAVLESASTLGPGAALTAPDLAKEFKLRSPEVQGSLEKLAANMMLDRAFGTTDDYQGYYLSRAGAAFLSMWNRTRN